MEEYEVSVVIPVYNSAKTVLSSIESVLKQTYSGSVEIIIVDDGSFDNSVEVIDQFVKKNDLNNFVIYRQKNKGVSSARNVGLKNARGKWIALLDSDDEWLPAKLERQFEVLKSHPQIDFLGTSRNNEHFKRILFKRIDWLTKISPRFLLYKFIFVVPTVIFKREILEKVGYFNEEQKYAEEGNYFIRICNSFNCYFLNESLVITGGWKPHFGESGLSGNLKEMEKGELKNLLFAKKIGIVGFFEYLFLVCFSLAKYLRRVILVSIRKK